jgi:hypothetical protein
MNRPTAYIRLALGLPIAYTVDIAAEEIETGDFSTIDYVWHSHANLVDKICRIWSIDRERFFRSMAAPKPGRVAHLLFNAELKQLGFEPYPEWPRGQGLLIPTKQNGAITGIRFKRMSEILRNGVLSK